MNYFGKGEIGANVEAINPGGTKFFLKSYPPWAAAMFILFDEKNEEWSESQPRTNTYSAV